MFLHKLKGPGVRYEISVSNETGRTIWANSPFLAGQSPDLKKLKFGLLKIIPENQKVIKYSGYVQSKLLHQMWYAKVLLMCSQSREHVITMQMSV